ncbi:transposase family protein [Streptomyces sp. NBC_00963]|uniref:helix-turn-helix domain-containing protein n=1 Tax=Streptomyces sp. NBC_00963 TaxID=2903697 RepID=UPI003865C055
MLQQGPGHPGVVRCPDRRPTDGPPHFLERLVATLVHLRTGLTQEALAVAYGVGSSSTSRVINALRPLLAERGFAVPDRPDLRLRTLEDVFAYAEGRKDRTPAGAPMRRYTGRREHSTEPTVRGQCSGRLSRVKTGLVSGSP